MLVRAGDLMKAKRAAHTGVGEWKILFKRPQLNAKRALVPNRKRKIVSNVAIVLGLLVLVTPVVLTIGHDYALKNTAARYQKLVESIQPPYEIDSLLKDARQYNANLAQDGHHAMPPQDDSPGFKQYMQMLRPPELEGTLSRIRIPSIGVDLPVYHGTSDAVLYRGAGHMFGSDLPVGGIGNTSVITAHTGMVNATMFDNLPTLKFGEDIYIQTLDQTLRYQMRSKKVVAPDEVEAITYEPGVDKLVLLTCTPYGINTDRLLVEAVRVPLDHSETQTSWWPEISWWMWVDVLVVFAVIGWLVWERRRDLPWFGSFYQPSYRRAKLAYSRANLSVPLQSHQ